MPGARIAGLEARREIRRLPGQAEMPIIAMTANTFAEDKLHCLYAGTNDFLIKPFNPDEFFPCLWSGWRRAPPSF